jgi:3-dehydroquinate dehydratase-2
LKKKPKTKAKVKTKTKPKPLEIHVLNGPNLNMLGYREPEIYGSDTLLDLEKKIKDKAKELLSQSPQDWGDTMKIHFFQTNYEGEMLEYIQLLVVELAKKGRLAGVIINPGAWTHTSVALRDAVLMLKPVPIVEVHISNLLEREEFRHHSFIEDVVDYRVMGMGQEGYLDALRWLLVEMKKDRPDVH